MTGEHLKRYNRIMVDHVSNVLLAPTVQSARNLKNEQVQGSIFMVGNTVIDAVELCLQSDILDMVITIIIERIF